MAANWIRNHVQLPTCASRKVLRLILLFTNLVVKSLQRCQSKMTRIWRFANRLAFSYANMLDLY